MIKLKKYGFFAVIIVVNLFALIYFPDVGRKSFALSWGSFKNFLITLIPVFICIGLLDVWVEREVMLNIMGEESGMRGILVSFLLGVVTAVPLYALLPVAGMLLKKGGKVSNVLIFICSCTSIRIPLLLFEVSSMGWRFTGIRFFTNILIVAIIAFAIDGLLTKSDKKDIYNNANQL